MLYSLFDKEGRLLYVSDEAPLEVPDDVTMYRNSSLRKIVDRAAQETREVVLEPPVAE